MLIGVIRRQAHQRCAVQQQAALINKNGRSHVERELLSDEEETAGNKPNQKHQRDVVKAANHISS
jgi:hypothetical protein